MIYADKTRVHLPMKLYDQVKNTVTLIHSHLK